MVQKIGPREMQLRAQREARFSSAKVPKAAPVQALRDKVSQIPAKRRPKAKAGKAKP